MTAGLRAEGLTVLAGDWVVFADADVAVPPGTSLALTGGSGSGKSSVLRALAGLDPRVSGRVVLDGSSLASRDGSSDPRVGFLPQQHTLLGALTAVENVALTLLAKGVASDLAWSLAESQLADLGLPQPTWHNLLEELSGGQQQRVAVGRALVGEPALLCFDDPTSELDAASAGLVWRALDAAVERGVVLVVATSDPEQASRCDQVIALPHGVVPGR